VLLDTLADVPAGLAGVVAGLTGWFAVAAALFCEDVDCEAVDRIGMVD
jgi:hypothetical protein